MTKTFPETYPSDGIILSNDGDASEPPLLPILGVRTIPKIGHFSGIEKSFNESEKGKDSDNALDFALAIIIFLYESPMLNVLLISADFAIARLRSLFSGLAQYFFSYSGRESPDDFFSAFVLFAQDLEQKWLWRFLYQAKCSLLSFPQRSQRNVIIIKSTVYGMDSYCNTLPIHRRQDTGTVASGREGRVIH